MVVFLIAFVIAAGSPPINAAIYAGNTSNTLNFAAAIFCGLIAIADLAMMRWFS